jgi:hypothetical protein
MKGGVTGHQDLGSPETIQWVSSLLHTVLVRERVTEGLTCLARGTDQIYARALTELGLPFVAVIPCRRIEDSFESEQDLGAFRHLLERARETILLPFESPSEEAYYAAGKKLVDNSDLLIAVWNGKPAKGLGGTADVIAYAFERNVPIVRLNPVTREGPMYLRGTRE